MTYVLTAAAILSAIVLTLLHLPRWITRGLMRAVPIWVQALGVHALGYVVGGVTGHVVGALMAIPYYFLARFVILPALQR